MLWGQSNSFGDPWQNITRGQEQGIPVTHRGIAGLRVQVHFTWGRTGGESMPLLRVVL